MFHEHSANQYHVCDSLDVLFFRIWHCCYVLQHMWPHLMIFRSANPSSTKEYNAIRMPSVKGNVEGKKKAMAATNMKKLADARVCHF